MGESEAAGAGPATGPASAARAWESDPRALRICKEQQLRACLSTMPHPWDERNVVWQRLGKKKKGSAAAESEEMVAAGGVRAPAGRPGSG